jgi:hypothetical protein
MSSKRKVTGMSDREQKAKEMLVDPRFAVYETPSSWTIHTPTGHLYTITKATETCDCPDAKLRHFEDCKHVLALRMWLNRPRPTLGAGPR